MVYIAIYEYSYTQLDYDNIISKDAYGLMV